MKRKYVSRGKCQHCGKTRSIRCLVIPRLGNTCSLCEAKFDVSAALLDYRRAKVRLSDAKKRLAEVKTT
jgi:hypothetical protein